MCGRFAQSYEPAFLARELEAGGLGIDDVRDLSNHHPTYNAAPSTFQAVYRTERSSSQRSASSQRDAAQRSSAQRAAPQADGAATRTDLESGNGAQQRRDAATMTDTPRDAADLNINGAGDGAIGDTADDRDAGAETTRRPRRVLQAMKWGLIPHWTKRPPEGSSSLKTINCRDDSLLEGKAMWASCRARRRCIVPVEGYYEWLKKGPKEKIPHFTRRKDGRLLLMAGLYDAVTYETDPGAAEGAQAQQPLWSFTIVTTAARADLSWLHDRMPLIFDQGDAAGIAKWLDGEGWTDELAAMVRPFEGELECYAVRKEVGKIGTSSPSYIVPIDSKENKSNIANFFARQAETSPAKKEKEVIDTSERVLSNGLTETNAPLPTKEEIKAESTPDFVFNDDAHGVVVKEEAKHMHPITPRRVKEELVDEADLPFEFVPSHLETRPLEPMHVWTYRCGKRNMNPLLQFVSLKMRKYSKSLLHLKRLRALPESDKRIKLEPDDTDVSDAAHVKVDTGDSTVKHEVDDMDATKKDTDRDGHQDYELEMVLCRCEDLDRATIEAQLQAAGVADGLLCTASVSRYPALSQKQYDEWKSLWPLSWRVPALRTVKLSRDELTRCELVMRDCLAHAHSNASAGGDLPVAAIAWDPTGEGKEIARAVDRRASKAHPLKHAVLELASAVAANEVVRRLDNPDAPSQYLCTGLTVFLSHEPCTMCAMALLHARVERVFFARESARGAFATDYGIHWRKELNHRFTVFGGWMRESAPYVDDDVYV